MVCNKILAIDVGLKNLAMCIMSAENKDDFQTFKIHLWDVYNTLEDNENHKCQTIQKNSKICNKKCIYKYEREKSKFVYTCKAHFPMDIKIEKGNTIKKKMVNDYLLQDIAKIVLSKLQDIYDTNQVFKELNSIIIELQPKINAKMSFVSHIIYGKLVELYKDTKVTVRFVRAANKLKCYTGPLIECKLKGEYAKRKWLSIQYTKWFLENKFTKEQKEKWLPFLESHKTQADMSDTYCMSINAIHGIPKKQFLHKNSNELK